MRVERDGWCGGGMLRDCRPVGIEPHDAGAMRRQPVEQRRLGDQHRRAGIRQHEGQPLGRIGGVERQIGAAGLEDAEKPDDHLERALDAQPHHRLRADAEIAQVMRQLVGARIELTIAEALVLEHHRDGVGALVDLGLEQLRQGGRWNRTGGVVPLAQDGVALLGRENVEAADRPLRLRNRRLQQPNQPARQRLNARAIEQVGGVFQCPVDPRRLAVRAALLC